MYCALGFEEQCPSCKNKDIESAWSDLILMRKKFVCNECKTVWFSNVGIEKDKEAS